MYNHLSKDLIQHLRETFKVKIDSAPDKISKQLDKLPLNLDSRSMLKSYWPRKFVYFGPYNMWPVEKIVGDDLYRNLHKQKLVTVGNAMNGDALVFRNVNEDTTEVGLVSHDQLFEEKFDLKRGYMPVASSLAEFLYRVVEERFLPIDFYSARDLKGLREELAQAKRRSKR